MRRVLVVGVIAYSGGSSRDLEGGLGVGVGDTGDGGEKRAGSSSLPSASELWSRAGCPLGTSSASGVLDLDFSFFFLISIFFGLELSFISAAASCAFLPSALTAWR